MTKHPKREASHQPEATPEPRPEAEVADAGEVERLQEQVAALTAEVERLSHEREELMDLARRLQADFDNFRRRTREEAVEQRHTAAADLMRDLLPALDNLDRALEAGAQGGDAGTLRQGVALTRDQLFTALAAAGLEPVPAVGQRFDPNLHEALERAEAEGRGVASEGAQDLRVVEEFRRGYLVRGRLLRPSLVKVAATVRRDGNDG